MCMNKRERVQTMKKFVLLFGILAFCISGAYADEYSDYTYEEFQTIYKEVPVQSYYAYPDDPNFIPETEFMDMDSSINYDDVIADVQRETQAMVPGVSFAERPTVICRDFNCTRLNNRITRTFLFNSLATMLMTNAHSRLYICEADPFSRSCLQSGISFPVRSGVANAIAKIPKATISQVNLSRGLSRANVSINYEMLINGIQRVCEPTEMNISVPNNSQATLTSREFSCNFTSDGTANISILFSIDYIDLDYGLIGGYYSVGVQGATIGGGSGYLVFKTEFTSTGAKARYVTFKDDSTMNSQNRMLQPGEYSVEAMPRTPAETTAQ